MISYASVEYYTDVYGGSSLQPLPAEAKAERLMDASRAIDSLTFNRIVGMGFDNLTQFQKDIVQRVCCKLAEFMEENADVLTSALSGYSINGVTQNYSKGLALTAANGVLIPSNLYSFLAQTGLTCRAL